MAVPLDTTVLKQSTDLDPGVFLDQDLGTQDIGPVVQEAHQGPYRTPGWVLRAIYQTQGMKYALCRSSSGQERLY